MRVATRFSWRELRIPLLLFAVALTIRLAYFAEFRPSPIHQVPIYDAQFYDEMARALATGGRFTGSSQAYFFGPLYPFFLSVVYLLTGCSRDAASLLQLVLGAVQVALVYVLARRSLPTWASAAAALLVAGCGVSVFYEGLLLMEWLLALLSVVLLLLVGRGPREWSARCAFVVGAVVGLSALGRPALLLLAPALAGWAVLAGREPSATGGTSGTGGRAAIAGSAAGGGGAAVGSRAAVGGRAAVAGGAVVAGRRWMAAALVLAGYALAILPVTLRNARAEHDFVPITCSGGFNLWVGNGEGANGVWGVKASDLAERDHTGREYAARVLGRPPRSSEVSQLWAQRTLRYVGSHPGDTALLLLRKLQLYWNRQDMAQIEWFEHERQEFAVLRALPQGFSLLSPLALLGMVVGWRRRHELAALYLFVAVSVLSICLFFITDRYRVQMIPAAAIFAGHLLHWVVSSVRAHRWRSLGLAAAAMAATLWATSPARARLDPRLLLATQLLHEGFRLDQTGSPELATLKLQEATRLAPDEPSTHLQLGIHLRERDQTGPALAVLRRAQQLEPDNANVPYQIAVTLYKAKRPQECLAALDSCLALDPLYAAAYDHRGLALAALGQDAAAEASFRRSIELNPDRAAVYNNLGTFQGRRGDNAAAAESFRRALRVERGYVPARRNLALAYAALGQIDAARQEAQRVLQGEPNDRVMRQLIDALERARPPR